MSVELNRGTRSSQEIRPLRIANSVHLVLGGVHVLVGFLLLLLSRNTMQDEGMQTTALVQVSAGTLMMILGGLHIALSMRFWGFGFAPSEVPKLGPSSTDKAQASTYLYGVLTEGIAPAPAYPGALGGVLQSMVRNLSFAPESIRYHTFIQAMRALYVVVVLASFTLAWIMADPITFPWMSVVFFFLAIAAVRPQETLALIRRGALDTESNKNPPIPTLKWAIALVVISIFGPALISMSQSIVPEAPFSATDTVLPTLAILLPALAASALFFWALIAQTRDLASSEVRYVGDPKFRVPDLGSGLADHLVTSIPKPHKQYAYSAQKSQGISQDMTVNLLYETEPSMIEASSASSLKEALQDAWNSPIYRPLLLLELLGLALGLASCALMFSFASAPAEPSMGMAAVGFLASSQFALISGHKLWKRGDFRSTIYHIWYKVNFSEVSRELGNSVTGVGSIKDIGHRIHNGRIDVCVAEINSVCFHKGGQRHVTSIDLKHQDSNAVIEEANRYFHSTKERLREFDAEEGLRQQLMTLAPQEKQKVMELPQEPENSTGDTQTR